MGGWLRRLRGALGLGVTWAVVGFVTGMGIEVVHNIWPNPITAEVDIWPMALAVPGLFGGMAFSVVLGILGRRRRFDELSLTRTAAWGALGGVLAAMIPVAMVVLGLASPNIPLWSLALGLAGPFALGGGAAAAATLAVARMAEDDRPRIGDPDVEEAGLTEAEKQELLGG